MFSVIFIEIMQDYLPQEEIQDINKYFNPKYGISFKCTEEHAKLVCRVMKLNDEHLRKISELKAEANLSKSKYLTIRWFYKPGGGWFDYFAGGEMICRRVSKKEVDAATIDNMKQELKPDMIAIPFKIIYKQSYCCAPDSCVTIDGGISCKERVEWLLIHKDNKVQLDRHKYISADNLYILKINAHRYMNIGENFHDTDIFFEE